MVVVKIDSTVETDALKAVDEIQTQGINRLDLVIANAGMARSYPKVSELKVAELQDHLAPNVFGVVWLYQATLPLLRVSDQPKWVYDGFDGGVAGGKSTRVCSAKRGKYANKSCVAGTTSGPQRRLRAVQGRSSLGNEED